MINQCHTYIWLCYVHIACFPQLIVNSFYAPFIDFAVVEQLFKKANMIKQPQAAHVVISMFCIPFFWRKSRCKLLVYCLNEKGHKDRTKEFIFSEGILTSKMQTIWRWWKKPDTLISLAARRQNWHKLQQSFNFLEQLPHFWTRYLSNTNPSHVGFGPSTGRIFHPISVREHLVRKWCSLSDIPPNCIFLHCLLKRVRKVLGVSTDCCIL